MFSLFSFLVVLCIEETPPGLYVPVCNDYRSRSLSFSISVDGARQGRALMRKLAQLKQRESDPMLRAPAPRFRDRRGIYRQSRQSSFTFFPFFFYLLCASILYTDPKTLVQCRDLSSKGDSWYGYQKILEHVTISCYRVMMPPRSSKKIRKRTFLFLISRLGIMSCFCCWSRDYGTPEFFFLGRALLLKGRCWLYPSDRTTFRQLSSFFLSGRRKDSHPYRPTPGEKITPVACFCVVSFLA